MTWLYHFTHQNNLESILAAGGLQCDSAMAGHSHAVVGNRDIKTRRKYRPVSVPPHGVVADYVPFYFAPRSPMLFLIHNGNVPECEYGQEDVVYFCATVEEVVAECAFCYTDRNAARSIAGFFNDVEEMEGVVDMPLMSERYWGNSPDDLDRVDRRMAEFLVHRFFPWSLVKGIGVYGQGNSRYVQSVLDRNGQATPIEILRDWYF